MVDKIDSNITGLRIAEETAVIGVVDNNAIWLEMEPNSYGEFGPQIKTTSRSPITKDRQRKKGIVTDLDASAGFQNDFVQESLYPLMPGFMFSDWRAKTSKAVTAVSGASYTVADVVGLAAGDLIFASGFTIPGNNGLKAITATGVTTISVSGLTAEAAPPADAKIRKVGAVGSAGDITVSATAGVVTLGATTLDLTSLGVIPGEWMFIGGDAAGDKFDTAANNGFVRVKSVAAAAIVLDRYPGTMVTDSGAGKTIRLFVGDCIKNESDSALIKRRSYQMERSLGAAGFEYIKGCVSNTFELNVSTADKVTVDFGFIGIDAEYRTSVEGAKAGTRPSVPEQEAFNSSSDFSRLRMLDDSANTTLFTYVTEFSLTINNGVKPSKAVGVLGAFDVGVGDFVAAGSVNAYFTSIESVAAVRNNTDVSYDFALVKENAGWLFDIPYMSLADGRLQVEKDTEIKIPLTMEGAEHPTLHHSLLVMCFHYLPNAAQ